MEKVNVYYSIRSGGDGSAYLAYFLTEQEAYNDQDSLDEGWGELCLGKIETFIGSNVHKKAERNSKLKGRQMV